MELIERYVYAVTRALPESQREDVAKELRSDIEDMIEHEKGSKKERVIKVLESLGRPETLAQKYKDSPQYLLGPKWYGLYLAVLKKVAFIVVPIVFIVQLVLASLESSNLNVFGVILEAFLAVPSVLLHVLFWITAVFVFLERADIPNKEAGLEWTIDELPELPIERHAKLSDTIANLTFYVGLIVVVILTATKLGIHDAGGVHIQFFNPTLWMFWLPAILLLLAGLAIKEAVILKRGLSRSVVIAGIVLNTGLTAAILGLYLNNMLINPTFASHTQAVLGDHASFNMIVGISMAVFAIGYVWETVVAIRRIIVLNK